MSELAVNSLAATRNVSPSRLAAVFSTDHKTVGKQFLFFTMAMAILGGVLSMLIRWQLGFAGHDVPVLGNYFSWRGGLPPDVYTMVVSMHGTIMIFFVVIPVLVSAFGNFLIPLKIGARDMAFPFLNGLTFWATLPAAAIILTGFWLAGGAASAGWTMYPPLSALAQNHGGPALSSNLLRIDRSTWPMLVCVANFIAWFLLATYLFIARSEGPSVSLSTSVGSGLKTTAALTASATIAILLTRGEQFIAWDGQSCWFLSILLLGVPNILGAVNYLTTIVLLRCRGMRMFRLPLSVWSLFITALLVLLATPVLTAVLLMNLIEHQSTTTALAGGIYRFSSFFTQANWLDSNSAIATSGGGVALLHQHLFWFYSHPAVYIMILPAMGMVSDILATFARKPVFGYRPMVIALFAIAFLGFLVWAHHMFQSGMNPALGTAFAISTMFIAVPSSIKTFNWLATIWGGSIVFEVPMLHALAFIGMFVIGGLSGIFLASTPIDVHLHDTVFIVAHIHYVLFGGSIFGIFAATSYYFPKMFGRMMSHQLGAIHFWLTLVGFNCTFFAMHFLGTGGVPRRVADPYHYDTFAHFLPMNQFISVSAFVLGVSQILFFINFFMSLFIGQRAPKNPWHATTLEWETTSPPPAHNFEIAPVVYHGPYEYASPLVTDQDYLPQTRFVPAP